MIYPSSAGPVLLRWWLVRREGVLPMKDLTAFLQARKVPGQPPPLVRRGAEDQAAAYAALLAQWQDVDAEANERDWQRVCAELDDAGSGQHY